MSPVSEIEGLKFPDEMVTRFFFRNGLHHRPGRVLELGCGNANNLALFAGYGWDCAGLDIDASLLEQGRRNFRRAGHAEPQLVAADLNDPLPGFGELDVLLLPSSLYYVTVDRAQHIVRELAPTLRPGAHLFGRFRTPNDHRHGKGTPVGPGSYRLDITETSEAGCVIAFYTQEQVLDLLAPCRLDPGATRTMKLVFDNLGRGDVMVRNDEIVVWARTPADPSKTRAHA